MLDTSSLFRLGTVTLRLAAMLVVLPLPGFRNLPASARVLLALALAVVLTGASPRLLLPHQERESMLATLAADLLTGVSISLVAALVIEAMVFGGQVIAVQAGFSYAATIDPFSDSDSGILPSMMSLVANLLLFQSPLYAALIRALAAGMSREPGLVGARCPQVGQIVLSFFAHCIETGIRLALPVIALMLLADLCMGLFSRLQPQIQFLSISFSLKLLGAMVAMAGILPAARWLYLRLSNDSVAVLQALTR